LYDAEKNKTKELEETVNERDIRIEELLAMIKELNM
jgi:hypothetical protein